MDFRFDIILGYAPLLGKGVLLTIGLSLLSILIGSLFGLVIGFGRMSGQWLLRVPAKAYIHFFRGTPLYVQILIVHFGAVPLVIGKTNPIVAAIAALSLNCAAYTAEIYRAGIQSIDRGQFEAAYSSGMSKAQTMRYIILPQAVKRMLPAFGNEFVVLIKDSSLVAIIAAPELMYWSNAMRGQYYRVWEPYLAAAFIYLILTYTLSKILARVEARVK
ncbi:amino acid ABC transporter permease [Paenibacillus caseinilyticus]|uniref:Amino acid ABC transporter permease n=1 Tax=Paenibacillus mucilaginosus K02 TaxID=997761 RepID=I0BTB5_9BACL|nr:amino acid ABC transporter permease [Paenibacillus mucilaginosus]AFH65612.1 amino acid ABC transporter permease [Paenibacillus mucilaginosus K02]